MDEKENYLYKYHLESINKNRYRVNPDGSVTTIRIMGVPYKGRIYNVPGYNNKTGKDLTESQAIEVFKKQLEADKFPSYKMEYKGDIKNHPANKAARKLHIKIEEDGKMLEQRLKQNVR